MIGCLIWKNLNNTNKFGIKISVTEFQKSLSYAFREGVENLSRLDFMRAVTQLASLYHKAYKEQNNPDKEQINNLTIF